MVLFATRPLRECTTPFPFLFLLLCFCIGSFTIARGKKLKDILHSDNQLPEPAEVSRLSFEVGTQHAASDQQIEGSLQRSVDVLRLATEAASTEVRLAFAELRNPRSKVIDDPNPISCDVSLMWCCADALS